MSLMQEILRDYVNDEKGQKFSSALRALLDLIQLWSKYSCLEEINENEMVGNCDLK